MLKPIVTDQQLSLPCLFSVLIANVILSDTHHNPREWVFDNSIPNNQLHCVLPRSVAKVPSTSTNILEKKILNCWKTTINQCFITNYIQLLLVFLVLLNLKIHSILIHITNTHQIKFIHHLWVCLCYKYYFLLAFLICQLNKGLKKKKNQYWFESKYREHFYIQMDNTKLYIQ